MSKKTINLIIILVLIAVGLLVYRIFFRDNQVKKTKEECFTITEEGIITEYKEICGTKINIPDKIKGTPVKAIEKYVFKNKGLTVLILPETLEKIGISAFEGNEIEELVIPDSVKEIKPYAFYNNKIAKLSIGSGVKDIGFEAFNDNQVKKNAFIYQRTNSGINKEIIVGYAGKERDNVKIPEGTTTLYLSSFADCQIKKVILPNSLERIESRAFENNLIEEIEIPSNVKIIGQGALAQNNSLNKIIIKGKTKLEDFNLFDVENLNTDIIIFEK